MSNIELLHTVDGLSWIYVEGTKPKNYLLKTYGKKSMVATYARKNGVYGWNFAVPFDDLRELRITIKEMGNKQNERSQSKRK